MSYRILVVDDEAPIRDNICRFLRLEGHAVEEATNGLQALELMRRQPHDLVLCDVMMPQCNGFEVLAAMQADPVLKGIPLVFLSASAEPEKLQEGLAMGARQYVTKPFNLQRLREVMAELLVPTPGAPE